MYLNTQKAMNIILTGFMGAGKSTVARKLNQILDWEVLEMDEMIIKKSRLNTIPEIFDKHGELGFRELEVEVAKEISSLDKKIISTGGGVVMNLITMLYLKKNGRNFYLHIPFSLAEKRLGNKDDRPLFSDKEKTRKLYDFRVPIYEYYADDVVEVTLDEYSINKSKSSEIANIIFESIQK